MDGGGVAPSFLTSALDAGEWSDSRSRCFTPRETWARRVAEFDHVENRKICPSAEIRNLSFQIVQPVA
jgi:hypothetical protein